MKRTMVCASVICLMAMTGCAREAVNPYFQGKVLEVQENSILVEPLEGEEELKSADQITVSTDVISVHEVPEMKEGMLIQVVYNGEIAESDPAQIKEVFAIYLIDESGEPVSGETAEDHAQTSNALSPTGYPSDEVQRMTVYYQGTRYQYMANGVDQPLPDGFEKMDENIVQSEE